MRWIDVEARGKRLEGGKARIALGAFDGTDVGAMKATSVSEFLLAEASLVAELFH